MKTVQKIPPHVQLALNVLEKQEQKSNKNFKRLGRKLKNPEQTEAKNLFEIQQMERLEDCSVVVTTTRSGYFSKEPCLCRMAKQN